MRPRFPDPSASRAILIGASRYHFVDQLPNIPGVQNNLWGLRDALTDSLTGTFQSDNCRVLLDPTRDEAGRAMAKAGDAATDVLFVYYSGHGLLDERGRLFLALPNTDTNHVRWSALPFDIIREEINDSRASTRILILDSCFSGRAIEAMTDRRSIVSGQIDIAGTYVITATEENVTAYAPTDYRYTAFTGALLDAVRQADRTLMLDELFLDVKERLRIRSLPRPNRRTVGDTGIISIFRHSGRTSEPNKSSEGSIDSSFPLIGHTDAVSALSFSPDGRFLVTGGLDGNVRLWDVETQTRIDTAEGHFGPIYSVAFFSDSQMIACGTLHKAIGLFQVKKDGGRISLLKHANISSPENALAIGFFPSELDDGNTQDHLSAIHRDFSEEVRVGSVAFSSNGKTYALCSTKGDILLRHTYGRDFRTAKAAPGCSVAFSPDGNAIAIGDPDGSVQWALISEFEKSEDGDAANVWKGEQNSLGARVAIFDRSINTVAFSCDGKLVASGSKEGVVRLWQTLDYSNIAGFDEHAGAIYALAFSPDGKWLATAGEDSIVRLRQLNSRKYDKE